MWRKWRMIVACRPVRHCFLSGGGQASCDRLPRQALCPTGPLDGHRSGGCHIARRKAGPRATRPDAFLIRSEEHTSELQSLMRISYAVFCLKKKNTTHITPNKHNVRAICYKQVRI